MTEKHYEINLRPVEHYFFGGERTFGQTGDEQSYYFATSNPYPQQSTLLGLLRYWLLEQNDKLPLNKHQKEADLLIGQRSFKVGTPAWQNFGAIQNLSPLYLKHQEQYYRIGLRIAPGAIDFAKAKAGHQVLTPGGISDLLPVLAGYDAKKGLEEVAISVDGNTSIDLDKIFEPHTQVGILKESTQEGFFKQQNYRLAKGWQFCFFATMQGDFKLGNGLVKFGADQRPFTIAVQEIKKEQLPSWQGLENQSSLTLLSDALVKDEQIEDTGVTKNIYKHCHFAISQTTDFRTVRMGHPGQAFHKDEEKYNLLKRGTILFPKEGSLTKLEDALKASLQFRQLGFNQYFKSKS